MSLFSIFLYILKLNKFKFKILFAVLLILSIADIYSQDTTKPVNKPVTKTDTSYVQNFLLADHNHLYIDKTDPDTLTRRRFLWYPAKSFEDIFNFVPGYYGYFMDVGQLNPFSFNQMAYTLTGVLRNGRPINDMIDGSVDWNLFSRNEVSEIEFSNGYANNVYGYQNTINIIPRQLFQYRPYTEISYYQDRYDNEYFDGNFHQNFFKSLNFNFGITKHSYSGHYKNSDFDKWQGRFNLNFAPSAKLNFFANVNYAHIQKGLNEGIDPDIVNLGDKEIMLSGTNSTMINTDAYEIKERFDVDLGTVFTAGKSSFSKIQFYVSNSMRHYRDEENRSGANGVYTKNNYHWINYGVKLNEQLNFKLKNSLRLLLNSEAEYSNLTKQKDYLPPEITYYYHSHSIRLLQEANLALNNIIVGGFVNFYTPETNVEASFSQLTMTPGAKVRYRYIFGDSSAINIKGIYNYKDDHVNISASVNNKLFNAGAELYYYRTKTYIYYPTIISLHEYKEFKGINGYIDVYLKPVRIKVNHSYNLQNEYSVLNPEHSGIVQLSWEDNAFKNKLEYKIGLVTRYWSAYSAMEYSGYFNDVSPYKLFENGILYDLKIPANATLDFFIMGKIGKATIGLTFENILDRIIYNTGVYPFMDRGGLLNAMSRFNVTWNFFD